MRTRPVSPIGTDKLRVIGHGIDCDFYAPAPDHAAQEEPLVVQVGRLAAVKHQATTIEAVAATGARLALIGGVQAGSPRGYEEQLRGLIRPAGV